MGQVKTAPCVYNFTEGDKIKILTDPFQLASADYPIGNFSIQVNFTELIPASAATVYLMLSNDGGNFKRITGKEFVLAGNTENTFFIFGDASLSSAGMLQLGIIGVTPTGKISSVKIGTI